MNIQVSPETTVYKAINERNFRQVPQIERHLNEQQKRDIEVVSQVLPFKSNSYVVNELIDWSNFEKDPIFILTFPQRDMLRPEHFERVDQAMNDGMEKLEMKALVNEIRMELNPHPAGQMYNVPVVNGEPFHGVQHKYRETLLFFPSQGQTCHAYCTFCFRWPQFVGMDDMKFATKETGMLVQYLQEHPETSDVLFTGGDPMIMKSKIFASYIEPLLEADLPNLKTIRIGTKVLGYWPYKFTTDPDAETFLELFKKITDKGINLSIMAHFNHPIELATDAVKEAVKNLRAVGVQIRSQSPLLKHINDDADIWARMWREQVDMNIIPYYMFLSRDTGAQNYFATPLANAHEIFRKAYQQVSGVCRTVRGPSMSADPGKVQILGTQEVNGEKVFILRFLQGRNPDWVCRPFFAKYDPKAIWLDELKPAFGETEFFFERELDEIYKSKQEMLVSEDELTA